ncbi:hypothetical protein TRVA0_081S00232 [Trichomonascus vanleenenianus]|uniref:ankyrin repeat-containing protein ANK1 n=1 Tax=Trichomonascus vanleenenianus TaxID=2268995 RepID=UPI003ECA679F
MTQDEGASPQEQVLEAVRRNNVDLLKEVLAKVNDVTKTAELINGARDPVGNSPLHLGGMNGSDDAVDLILDQEGVEVDPVNRIDGDTPLHLAVKYSKDEPEHGLYMVEMFIEAGSDPRIRNKNGVKPIELADKQNSELIHLLQSAEFALNVDVQEDEDEDEEEGEGEESGSSSATDSA